MRKKIIRAAKIRFAQKSFKHFSRDCWCLRRTAIIYLNYSLIIFLELMGIPLFLHEKIHIFCMRNEFMRNLVLGALKNKKLFSLPLIEFQLFLLQFSKFSNQTLHKNLSRDSNSLIFFLNKKLGKKTKQEKSLLNPFNATDLFWYPLKTSENQRLLMFSGVIKRDQWHEMG